MQVAQLGFACMGIHAPNFRLDRDDNELIVVIVETTGSHLCAWCEPPDGEVTEPVDVVRMFKSSRDSR